MAKQLTPSVLDYTRCDHCGERTNRWLWRLIEVFPTREYEQLCTRCVAHQDATFTAEAAILHAIVVIGVRQGSWSPATLPEGGEDD